jgi:hypothetical protein
LSGLVDSHASDFGYDLTSCTSLIPIEESLITPGGRPRRGEARSAE